MIDKLLIESDTLMSHKTSAKNRGGVGNKIQKSVNVTILDYFNLCKLENIRLISFLFIWNYQNF